MNVKRISERFAHYFQVEVAEKCDEGLEKLSGLAQTFRTASDLLIFSKKAVIAHGQRKHSAGCL